MDTSTIAGYDDVIMTSCVSTLYLSLRGQSFPFDKGVQHAHLIGLNCPANVIVRHFDKDCIS